jgi:hypothetical protein
MWIIALIIISVALGGGTAAAFECAGVKLPSTIVICGDPELMRLADERQEAINEARGRIGEMLWGGRRGWQFRRLHQSMECRDAPTERFEQVPRRPGPR